MEDELCQREVSSVRCAAQASAVSESLLQYIMQRILEAKPVTTEIRTSLSIGEDEEDTGVLKPLPLPTKPIEAVLIRQALLLLRATCASWHCAGLVLSDYQEANTEGKLSTAVGSLQGLLEMFRTALEKQQESDEDDAAFVFEEKMFIDIEKVTSEVEDLLKSYFTALGMTCLAWLPSFQTGRKVYSIGSEIPAELKSVPPLLESERNSRRFHISCQSSFLALGTDLLAAYVSYRVSPSLLLGTAQSPTSSPLTSSTVMSPEEDGENPKGPALPAPHSGAIADLCRTIRLELEALGLFTPGGVLNVSSRATVTSGKDESSAVEAADGRPTDLSSSIKCYLVNCFDQLLDIAISAHGQGVEDVTAFPVQLRACLSKISHMKSLVNSQKSNMRMEENESEQIAIINLSSSIDSEKLWQTLTSPSIGNENSEKRDQAYTWDNFTLWRQRSKVQRDLLLLWGSSQSELAVLQAGIKDAQGELQTRADELKAAKSANLELNSILQLSLPTSPLSCATEGKAELAPAAGSRTRKNVDTSSSVPDGDVAKLKAEIEVSARQPLLPSR
jgi:hypothetical protein